VTSDGVIKQSAKTGENFRSGLRITGQDETADPCRVVRLIRTPLVICPVRHTYVVVR